MFVPSPYQKEIFRWMAQESGHCIVNAVAGSGKSKTLEEGAKCQVPAWLRILQVAFNVHIKDAMLERMPGHVEVVTFGSLGWRICRQNVRGVVFNKEKNLQIFRSKVDQVGDKERYNRLRPPILKMVSLLKALGEPDIAAWEEHSKMYGVELGEVKTEDKFEDVLNEVYATSVGWMEVMDYDDQGFQPVYRGWQMPQYDWVLIDEAQDSSPVQIEQALRLADTGRMMLVGDPDQSIYLFRGAHPDAMGQLQQRLGCIELPLSVCYRCPDEVIECARHEVPRIEAPSPNPNGKGEVAHKSTEDFVRGVASGDMVLSRTTAPLVKRCLEQLRMGRKGYVKGRDLVNQIITLVETIHGNPRELQDQAYNYKTYGRRPRNDVQEFMDRLAVYRSDNSARLAKAGRDAELLALEDRCDALQMFAQEADFVCQIIFKVEAVTSDGDQEGIVFMTGHKAKGLEAANVWILRPDLCPHPRAKTEIAMRQERNLLYVMKTRARKFLGFVRKEKDER